MTGIGELWESDEVMNPTPRDFYLLNRKEASGKLAVILDEQWIQEAIVTALAELGNSGATDVQMAGAKKFIATLHSLTVETKPIEAFPDHSELKHL